MRKIKMPEEQKMTLGELEKILAVRTRLEISGPTEYDSDALLFAGTLGELLQEHERGNLSVLLKQSVIKSLSIMDRVLMVTLT